MTLSAKKYPSRKQVDQSGYIGIILILLGTAGALFYFMKTYFTPTTIKTPGMNGATTQTTQFDSYMSDIGAAKAIANQAQTKALETSKLLDSTK